jgi:site-specific recombinase XerD
VRGESVRADLPPPPVDAPLVADILAALGGMPAATAVPEFRSHVQREGGPLARSLERLEAAHAAGELPTRLAAEVLAWAAFLALVRGHRGATTVARYVDCLARFLRWTHENHHDHATLPMSAFDAWQKWLRLTMRHGAKWQALQVTAVRNFYDWRHTRDIGPNCARDLRAPRENQRPPRKYTGQQLQGMLRIVGSYDNDSERLRDTALILFLLATGARREEVTKLDVHDLELARNTGVAHLKGKGAKDRDVPFEGPVVGALRDWLLHRESLPYLQPTDAVFVSINGMRQGNRLNVTGVEHRIKLAARRSGMRKGQWGVHRFRVTFATLLYDGDGGAAGAGIEEIRRLLGHESIETTRRYIDVSERARKTRLSANAQHLALGTRNTDGPRWLAAALGGGYRRD